MCAYSAILRLKMIQRLMIIEREVINLSGAWEKFVGNVTISIINLSPMCAYSAILQLKMINKSIEAIELSKIPRDIWARVVLSEIIPAQISDGMMLWILPRILGMLDIYIYIYNVYVADVVSILPRECSTQWCGAFNR